MTLWPRTTYKFRQLTARFDSENYLADLTTAQTTDLTDLTDLTTEKVS